MKKHIIFSLITLIAVGEVFSQKISPAGKYYNIRKDIPGISYEKEKGLYTSKKILNDTTYLFLLKETEDYFTVIAAVSCAIVMVEHFFLDGTRIPDDSSKGEWFCKKKNVKVVTIEHFLQNIFNYKTIAGTFLKGAGFYLKKTQIHGMVSP